MLRLARALKSRVGFADGERGVTLVELMVATGILMVAVVPAFTFLSAQQRTANILEQTARQQQQARYGLSVFGRSIRGAGYPAGYSYIDSSMFNYAATSDVSVYSDVNNDHTTELVRYWLDTTTHKVMRSVTGPDCASPPCDYTAGLWTKTAPLVSDVRNNSTAGCGATSPPTPLFAYFTVDPGTGAQTPIATPGGNVNNLVDINYVSLALVVDVTPGRSPTFQCLKSGVQLRNWRP